MRSEERRYILESWNATQVSYPSVNVVTLFEEQAHKQSETVAAVFAEQHISYGELNRRANQLAHHLRSLGVGPDVLVGLSVPRSLDLGNWLARYPQGRGSLCATGSGFQPSDWPLCCEMQASRSC